MKKELNGSFFMFSSNSLAPVQSLDKRAEEASPMQDVYSNKYERGKTREK